MGHRFSKTAALRQTNENKRKSLPAQLPQDYQNTTRAVPATYNRHSLPATVNNTSRVLVEPSGGLQTPAATTLNLKFASAAESPRRNYTTSCSSQHSSSSSTSSTAARQIIIKIQLAKMENGNGGLNSADSAAATTTTTIHLSELQPAAAQQTTALVHQQQYQQTQSDYRNSNSSRTAGSSSLETSLAPPTMPADQLVFGHINAIQIEAAPLVENDNDQVEYCEVLEHLCEANNNSQVSPSSKCCSQRKAARSASTSNAASAQSPLITNAGNAAAVASRRRCCKCTCRDALRRLMEPKAYKSKSKAAALAASQQQSQQHSSEQQSQWRPVAETPAMPGMPTPYPTIPASLRNLPTLPVTATSSSSSSNSSVSAEGAIVATSAAELAATGAGLSIWASNPHNRQFLVVSCSSTSVLTVGHLNDHSIRLTATSEDNFAVEQNQNQNQNSISQQQPSTPAPSSGPIVHSQVDYMHCLVPDLERITNSSFYWGKMDRYEAERLLEGKPEGTFLLRDSAQEEFLFSVTFRKYGRSLHARIEQSGHKFSFDCHDPSVYTATTVTGLLEHYKDPRCVMFFEPMLTIPLHRKTTFSLQKLCRATIVSNITYDGINELELPLRLKAYLKEYHYKQKLRVKPLDDPLYSCT